MTSTLAITAAFVLLLLTPSTAARKRRIRSGGGTYCVNDQNQRVPCVSSIIGAVIGGVGSCPNTAHITILTHPFPSAFLVVLLCICLALWRRRRRSQRMAFLPTTAAAKDYPETSTIASGSTIPNMADPIAQPPPAYMGTPHPEPYKHNTGPTVAPVGTYAAPQGPPPALQMPGHA